MKIGIDIDGVLNSQYNFCIDYGTKFCNEIGKYKLENVHAIDTTDMFLWSDEVAHKFWNKYRKDLVITLPTKKYASEVIEKLSNDGNKIYIITARFLTDKDTPEGERMRNIVKNWLKQNNIHYDKIIFAPEDKLEICKENKIDIMIEDKVENINNISKEIPVVCFNASYNKSCTSDNIYRAYSWYDVYYNIIYKIMVN